MDLSKVGNLNQVKQMFTDPKMQEVLVAKLAAHGPPPNIPQGTAQPGVGAALGAPQPASPQLTPFGAPPAAPVAGVGGSLGGL